MAGYPESLKEECVRLYRSDGLTLAQVAVRMGVSPVSVWRWANGRNRTQDLVPNGPLREAFEGSGMTVIELQHATGYNESTIARALGIRSSVSVGGKRYYNVNTSYEIAVKVVHALDVNPREVGL